eukprot:UN16154
MSWPSRSPSTCYGRWSSTSTGWVAAKGSSSCWASSTRTTRSSSPKITRSRSARCRWPPAHAMRAHSASCGPEQREPPLWQVPCGTKNDQIIQVVTYSYEPFASILNI